MYLVFVSSGSYSEYSVVGVWVGPRDPVPLLDALVSELSLASEGVGGQHWPTFEALRLDDCRRRVGGKLDRAQMDRLERIKADILKRVVPHLEAHGFVRANPTEVWLGD